MFPTRASAFQHSARSRLVRVPDWPKLPGNLRLNKTSMVATDSRGFVYVAHRGENPLLCLNPDGSLRRIVGTDVIKKSVAYDLGGDVPVPMEELWYLHGLHVDHWDNVWVTDVGRHLVWRFDPEGALTLTLGLDGETGCDDRRFNQPTHAIVAPSGEIFVTDGYGNSRVVKFAADGKFLQDWGTRGTGPGQFHTPHAMAFDRDGRLYVADRENDRAQIFNQEGKFLEVWNGLHSMDGICAAPDGRIYGSSGWDHAVVQFGLRGQLRQVWADAAQSDYPSRMVAFPNGDYPHGIWVDSAGSIYVAETNELPSGSRVLKFQLPSE